ncbi:MAG: hypothetical protein QXY49_05165, partial [Thermofilaceae archaeon]
MSKRFQTVLVLVTLAAGFLLATIYPSYRFENSEFKELKARGGPFTPVAFILDNTPLEGVNVSVLTS